MARLEFAGARYVRNYHLAVPHHELEIDKKKSFVAPASSPVPRSSGKGTGGDAGATFSLEDNLIIHGDNLKALKSLLPHFAGKVKCIYIDPPYNTGNENWVYNDNVNSPRHKDWLNKVVDKDCQDRHDRWLSMMMPRLKLLRELLRDDGVIFISIDDNEAHHLRMLMNEIFGEDNFIALITDVNNPKGRSDDKYIPRAHEYVCLYKKSGEPDLYGWAPDEVVTRRYRNTDADGNIWREIDLRKTGDNDLREDRPNLFYYFLFNQETKEFYPSRETKIPKGFIQIKPLREDGAEGNWRWELDTAKRQIGVLYPKLMPVRKTWSVFQMDYLLDDERIKPTSVWSKKEFNSERGTEQFMELGFNKEDFFKPKPVGLLKHILEFALGKDDVVLDSFAGSGTTAHAVLALNKEDGGNRKFILVEQEDYADTITAERVRRVIAGNVAPASSPVPQRGKGKGTGGDAGATKVREGLGGSFTYVTLGAEYDVAKILSGKSLPKYEEMAAYVFQTATGETLDRKKIDKKSHFIGSSKFYDVYLFYEPDVEKLKSSACALKLDFVESLQPPPGPRLGKAGEQKRKRLVFGSVRYVNQETLTAHDVEFSQLPYEVYRRIEDAA